MACDKRDAIGSPLKWAVMGQKLKRKEREEQAHFDRHRAREIHQRGGIQLGQYLGRAILRTSTRQLVPERAEVQHSAKKYLTAFCAAHVGADAHPHKAFV